MDNYEKTIKVDNIYEGKILSLRVETVEMPDKKYSKREIVDHVKGVGIIAFDGEDSIYLVRQYRKAIDEFTLEIPAGLVEVNEKPIETAKRELQEEIGYKPLDIEYLFDMHASPGFTNDKLSFFLAKNLEESKLELDEDEFLEKKSYKIEDVYNMVINGEITDAKTIIAVMYAKRLIDEK
ncbi:MULTISPECIES: NUDIX hydrolase [Anaerococcus]|uniref:Nudix-type nucleoside diphosphatase, YffH/AdpP family n=3 Tax=Anaerococcus TaxID=165779 RepID=C7HUC0_9FIRM|nr:MULTISPECIES: NUDIX domain-containing protein [Anaerococcus]EEU12688.1 nudix-type nucleoside diphosphatase, YffH/AdpP family [Anaerococcus vaginalis ATCC 51170]MBS4888601.1 NUDIX hydrolase [Anaerococcus vaginalis]MBS6920464.1 NUDIX hydrolase [Anaerococcus vaginalis]MDU0946506.1 NUDIX hydrolase [Anaerococcus vaginalis]MDU1031167.1 NUDIX hydrolase [Anaerococcus vaginalis]